jgi:hypothetical protein
MSLEEPQEGLEARMEARDKPDHRIMRDMLRADIMSWHSLGLFEDLQRAHRTRHCWWKTKNYEGTKDEELMGTKKVFPWPGAPDLESRIADQQVNEHLDIRMMAWWMGEKIVRARDVMDDNGSRKAQAWRHVLDYELDLSEADRVNALELLWNCVEETGYAVWREGWCRQWRKGRKRMKFDAVVNALAEQLWNESTGAGANVTPDMVQEQAMIQTEEALMNSAGEAILLPLIAAIDPLISDKEAKQLLKQFRKNRLEEADYFAPIPVPGMPKPKALVPGIDCLFPGVSQNPAETRFWEFEWVTRAEILIRAEREKWNEEWTQQLLNNPGLVVDWTQIGITTSGWELNGMDVGVQLQTQALQEAGMYQIAHLWQWGVNDMGLPAPFHTIVSGHIDGYALHECDPYATGRMPMLFVRRENKRNIAVSSKGIGHEMLSPQLAEKQTMDALLCQTQLRAAPPLLESIDGGGDGMRPGARMAMHSRFLTGGGGPRFLEVPEVSGGVIRVLELNRERVNDFYLRGPNVDPDQKRARRMRLLHNACAFYKQMVELMCLNVQKDVDEIRIGSVAGVLVNQVFTAEDLEGDLDVTFRCDVSATDLELARAKIELALKALSFDRSGQANTQVWFREVVGWIDNRLQTAGIQGMEAATEQAVRETNQLIAQMVAGIVVIPEAISKPVGNPELRMQILQQWAELPVNQQKLASDPLLMEQMSKYSQFLQFQNEQFNQNADIGRQFGVNPDLKNLQAPAGMGALGPPQQAQPA